MILKLLLFAIVAPAISFTSSMSSYSSFFLESDNSNVVCDRPCFEGSRMTRTLQSTSETVVADFNGDGRLDFVNQSSSFQTLSIQFGTGNGYFGPPQMIDSASAGFLISGDFNNDGNADLVNPTKVFFGNGQGGFSQPQPLSLTTNAFSFTVGDFNGDDNVDFAGQVFSTRNIDVFYGDGTGRFNPAVVVDFLTGQVESFVVADVNNDGISDLSATLTNLNTVAIARGSETGTFSTPVTYTLGGTGSAGRLATGDLDSDGDLDIVASTVAFSSDTYITPLLNSGSGTFTVQPQISDTSSNLPSTMLADVNSDNKLDFVAANQSGVLLIRLGNDNGTFQGTTRIPGIPGQFRMYHQDFTGDGVRDLGLNSTGVGVVGFAVLVNDGSGLLGPRQQNLAADTDPNSIALADFNEDGKQDVVISNDALSFVVAFGDGMTGFGSPISFPVTKTPRAVLVSDINNDGHKDIFGVIQNAGDFAARAWMIFGNGNGTFQTPIQRDIGDYRTVRAPVLADMNGDAFPDLINITTTSISRLFVNKGIGNGDFLQQNAVELQGTPRSVTTGDFNQDGFQDIAVLNGAVQVFLGNGQFGLDFIGNFPALQSNAFLFSADFNNDGLPDLAASTDFIGGAIGNPGKVVILLGAGQGGFGPPREFIAGRGAAQMTAADFDGDGNRDLAVANSGYNLGFSGADTRVTVLYGNGQGDFPRIQDAAAANFPKGIAALDFDTDGKTDIITADWGQSRLTLLKNICLNAPATTLPQMNANADVQVTEGDASDVVVNLSVTLNAPSTVPIRVRYYTAPFVGIPPALGQSKVTQDEELAPLITRGRRDYMPAFGQLVFSPGETSKSVPVTIRGDLIDEFDEYVSFFVTDATNAVLGDKQTFIKIIDNDAAPAISIENLSTAEGNSGNTVFQVPVSVSAVSEKPISVYYRTSGGTATANQDYLQSENVYTLPAGQASGAIAINVIADLTVESDETFFVDISDPVNATIGSSRGTATIMNDDVGGSVQFSSATYSVAESTGFINVSITRTGGNGGGVSVRFRTQGGTATPGIDYVENVTTVQFAANETSKNVQIVVTRDDLDEPDETVNLILDQPAGVTIGAPSSAVLTIQDSEGVPDLSISDVRTPEGDSGNTTMQVFIRLSRPTQRTVTMNFATTDITATSGSDYVAAAGGFTIPPGVTRATLNITLNGDTNFEPDETFSVNLSNAVNANLIDNQAIATIANDEVNPNTTLRLVSINQAGTGSANSDSYDFPSVSADGSMIAFQSVASNLAGTDTNGSLDVYVRNIQTSTTSLVSVNSVGTDAGFFGSSIPLISRNGRFVTFSSAAPNLVNPPPSIAITGVYVRDLQTNQTRLVSISSAGAPVNGSPVTISADGRFIVFQTSDQGVTSHTDSANTADLFVRDMQNNTTQLISVNAGGTATGNASSGNPSIFRIVRATPDGRFVLFPSQATDLVSIPTSSPSLYVRDLMTQTTIAPAVNQSGTQVVGIVGDSSFSDDGRYVFFSSGANTIVANDANNANDVFRRDLQTSTTTLVSLNLAGTGSGNAESDSGVCSADGRYVAFVSTASNLSTMADTNGLPDIYRRDMTTGVTGLASVNSFGTNGGNGFSSKPQISSDGQRIIFVSPASDLGTGDGNSTYDIYLRDMLSNSTNIVSANQGGTAAGNLETTTGTISSNGQIVAFTTSASNLIPNDLNGFGSDIFAFSKNQTGPYRAVFDFDGDGKTDIGIFRPADGSWWYLRSVDNTFRVFSFGVATDRIVPGDFTGDGKADIAVFRPSTGFWFIQRSNDDSFFSFPFGANGDVPVPADYDGDGRTDAAVFRPSNSTWFILNSGGGGTSIVTFGVSGDKPVAADYDGDAKADIAIFRPSDGSWWYLRSTDSQFRVYTFGVSTDLPVQGDFTGDGKADIAIWRPSTGLWFIQRSEDNSFYSVPFGATGDVPVPGDYDGDGRLDNAVFRPSNATWFAQRSTAGTLIQQFGVTTDTPVPSAYVP